MKKLATILLGLSFVLGSTAVFAKQDQPKTEKSSKKKKAGKKSSKKKKTEEKK